MIDTIFSIFLILVIVISGFASIAMPLYMTCQALQEMERDQQIRKEEILTRMSKLKLGE